MPDNSTTEAINLYNVDCLNVEPLRVEGGVCNGYVEVTIWNGDTYAFSLHDFDALQLASDLVAAVDTLAAIRNQKDGAS